MEAELITAVEDLTAVEDDWRRLAEGRGNAFVTPEWFYSWWDHYGEAHEPAVAVVRRSGGELAGVVPLVLRADAPPLARFAGAEHGDYFHPCAAEKDEAAIAAAAARALAREGASAAVVLDDVAADADWPVRMAEAGRLMTIEQWRAQLPFANLAGLDWEQYLSARSSNFRSQLRRRERSLNRDHDVVVRQVENSHELEGAFARFLELHDRRWQQREGLSSLSAERMRSFLLGFSARALERGWLRLRLLEVDGEAVASFLGWQLGGRYCFYQGGFDPDWGRQSVGIVLHATTIRAAIDEGASEYDLLLGDEAYKLRFADGAKQVRTVALAPRWSRTRAALSAEAALRRGWRRLPRREGGPGQLVRAVAKRLPTARRS